MRQTGRILARSAVAAVAFAVLVGCSFGQSTAAISQTDFLPDAPSAVKPAFSPDFSSSKMQGIDSALFVSSGQEQALEFLTRPTVPTSQERFQRFLQRSFSPAALRGDLWDAGQAEFHHAWPGYGGGTVGFERRYLAVLAGHTTGNFFGGYMFPSLLHQNPRSPRLGSEAPFWHRVGYAVTRVAITRNDFGKETFNSSLLLSTVAYRATTNLYYPRQQRGFGQTVGGIEGSMIDNVQGNLSREFMPDIQQFLWKHAPGFVKRLGSYLPVARF